MEIYGGGVLLLLLLIFFIKGRGGFRVRVEDWQES